MSTFEFGFTMLVVGMGGTLAILAFFAVLIGLIKKLLPAREDKRE